MIDKNELNPVHVRSVSIVDISENQIGAKGENLFRAGDTGLFTYLSVGLDYKPGVQHFQYGLQSLRSRRLRAM